MELQDGRYPEDAIYTFSLKNEMLIGRIIDSVEEQGIHRWPDWLVVNLLFNYAEDVFKEDNSRAALVFVVMRYFNYDLKLGVSRVGQFVLLYSSKQSLVNTMYFSVEGENYYVLPSQSFDSLSIANLPALERAFDFSLSRDHLSLFEASLLSKHEIRNPNDGLYFSVSGSNELSDYLFSHPNLAFEDYFSSPILASTARDLRDGLLPILNELDRYKSVDYLLKFVQSSFDYLTDDEQWGREYFAHPHHGLLLKAIDCEDRSFLFAWLVKDLLNLSVVGLHYPGHMSTAVAIPPQLVPAETRFFEHQGHRYYYADPTYIGADVGESQPKYRNVVPEIIPVDI